MRLHGIRDCRLDGWGAFLDVDPDGHERELLRPVRYRWIDEHGMQEHEAPQGYRFDGASKWFAWRLMGYPWGASARASCLHDRCFTERFRLSNGERVTFEYAADLYLCFLEATGVSWAQRNIEWAAVLSPKAKEVWDAHNAKFAALDAMPGILAGV